MLYLTLTRTPQALEELPNFTIKLTSVNTSEDYSRMELLQIKQETLTKQLTNLKDLGINIGENDGYAKTRKEILTQFFGSILTDTILNDEKAMPVLKPDEGGNDNGGDDLAPEGGAPSSDFEHGGDMPDLEPDGEISDAEAPTENDIDTEPPADVGYELQ